MKRLLDLSDVSTPQLQEIKKILGAGIPASAENDNSIETQAQLCHKSPPKGYPKEKGQYGDPECYRYPLNTKARCLAAWRYVHQERNKTILGSKFKKVESKIKSYAKKNYDLDLQVGESEEFDWEEAFVEYYDAETMGERCELIELEPEDSGQGEDNMDDKEKIEALEQDNKTLTDDNKVLKDEKDTWATEKAGLEEKASQVDELTDELNTQKEELETLRKFKSDTDEAAEKAAKLEGIKTKLDEAELEADVEADADYWLSMTDETLEKTIAKMSELKKGTQASASIVVPPVTTGDEDDPRKTVSDGLKERKQERGS